MKVKKNENTNYDKIQSLNVQKMKKYHLKFT